MVVAVSWIEISSSGRPSLTESGQERERVRGGRRGNNEESKSEMEGKSEIVERERRKEWKGAKEEEKERREREGGREGKGERRKIRRVRGRWRGRGKE